MGADPLQAAREAPLALPGEAAEKAPAPAPSPCSGTAAPGPAPPQPCRPPRPAPRSRYPEPGGAAPQPPPHGPRPGPSPAEPRPRAPGPGPSPPSARPGIGPGPARDWLRRSCCQFPTGSGARSRPISGAPAAPRARSPRRGPDFPRRDQLRGPSQRPPRRLRWPGWGKGLRGGAGASWCRRPWGWGGLGKEHKL